MPQGLCNSPASFMSMMMMSVFGDLNFSSLLCDLDDLLVFASSVEKRWKGWRLYSSAYGFTTSNWAQRNAVDSSGISVAKTEVIAKMTQVDLMEDDGCTPSVKWIESFLSMIFYYQHFIPDCSSKAEPLFALTAGQKRRGSTKVDAKAETHWRLQPADCTSDCGDALLNLRKGLLNCAILALIFPNHSFCQLMLLWTVSMQCYLRFLLVWRRFSSLQANS